MAAMPSVAYLGNGESTHIRLFVVPCGVLHHFVGEFLLEEF